MLDVGGVGYVIHCSDRTLAGLPGEGEAAALWTELLVREDLLQLFGFASVYEREWHRLLTSVQGVGAKASMAVLGTLGPEALARAIAIGDWAAVKAAPGVGPKIAQRVVNELKDKAPAAMMRAAAGRPRRLRSLRSRRPVPPARPTRLWLAPPRRPMRCPRWPIWANAPSEAAEAVAPWPVPRPRPRRPR